MRIRFLFFLILLSCSLLPAQKLKTLLKSGEEAMQQKNYNNAAQYFAQAMIIDSSDVQIQWKYAEASRLNYDLDEAKRWYEKILKADNMKTYPLCPYHIGSILQGKGKYKDARKYFDKYQKKFRNSKDKEKKQLALRAKMQMEACELAQVLVANPVAVTIEHLDSNINSRVSEYAPYEFDTALYFSSLRDKSETDAKFGTSFNKIYAAKRKALKDSVDKKAQNRSWRKAYELDSVFNTEGIHNANTSFNKDFTEAYISRCTQVDGVTFNCSIYKSEYRNGKWTRPQQLPPPVNVAGSNNTQPNISSVNGKPRLFFSSNRAGGEGGMDIWYCDVNDNGSFNAATNAGKKINTAEDDITPFYVTVSNTLYFSSTYHKGLGNFDVFKSELKDGSFQDAVNAGYPINSSQNDIYYSVNPKHNRAYVSSNRIGSYFEDKPTCCNDIYTFTIQAPNIPEEPKDTTKLIVDQMKILCPLTLYFHNDEPNPKTKDTLTRKTYKKTYEEYLALRPAYLKEYPKGKNGTEKEQAENRITAFMEDSVDAGMQDLEKFAALLEEVMKRNEKVKITMQGFCSPLASTDYNINLAKRRVSSLKNYFMEYKNGMFRQYVNPKDPSSGSITFEEVDVGELPTSKVSDDVKDTQNSVYSPGAARERKIQILAVSSVQ